MCILDMDLLLETLLPWTWTIRLQWCLQVGINLSINIDYGIGGVGFDINCGVRMIRTNLHERDLRDIQETLAQVRWDGAGQSWFTRDECLGESQQFSHLLIIAFEWSRLV